MRRRRWWSGGIVADTRHPGAGPAARRLQASIDSWRVSLWVLALRYARISGALAALCAKAAAVKPPELPSLVLEHPVCQRHRARAEDDLAMSIQPLARGCRGDDPRIRDGRRASPPHALRRGEQAEEKRMCRFCAHLPPSGVTAADRGIAGGEHQVEGDRHALGRSAGTVEWY